MFYALWQRYSRLTSHSLIAPANYSPSTEEFLCALAVKYIITAIKEEHTGLTDNKTE